MNEWHRIKLQRLLDEADNTDRFKRMADVISAEPDEDKREAMYNLIAESLGGRVAWDINSLVDKQKVV